VQGGKRRSLWFYGDVCQRSNGQNGSNPKGRQNGFDLEVKCPCRQNNCLTAEISLQYVQLCWPLARHFDASKGDLIGLDPRSKDVNSIAVQQEACIPLLAVL
jgi:hypothetical protein